MRRISKLVAIAGTTLIGLGAFAGAASASVTVDSTGHGFVGKGDVQTALGGLNNAQIQGMTIGFTQKSTSTQSIDWTCTKTVVTGDGNVNETTQERANITTTEVEAVVSSEARVKNQVTGYNLLGFKDGATSITVTTDGPAVGTCPNASSGFVFDEDSLIEGETVTTGGLYVNGVLLPITPAVAPA